MSKVAVITDSSACIPAGMAAECGIGIVPIEMVFEGRTYCDGKDDPGDFYRLLRDAKHPPTTAAPSPGLFLGAYKQAAEWAESILCVTLPANLSSTNSSSQLAIKLAEDEVPGVPIVSVSAGAVAAGQGLLVLELARAASQGLNLDQLVPLVTDLSRRVSFFAALDTLEYLARGGRVPKVAAWFGGMVGVRPVLTARDGIVKRISQVRSRQGAINKILRLMEEHNPERQSIQAIVMHADVENQAVQLQSRIEETFDCKEIFITTFTPVMGAHSGPGVIGVAFKAA
ncbi:DegV family protein [Dehalococcoidia bacterium]|nr:DegV family protein [Dehalococcoidia bacterium]